MTEATSAATAPSEQNGTKSGTSRWLFTATILVGSFLLFLVQPMVARMALPRLGGAPAVWNSAMLVYQALLLGGYAWAHWLGRFAVRQQLMLHGGLLVLAMLFLPVGLANMAAPSDNDVFLFVPVLLLASVGPLLFAVSAQAPLMQRWFATSAPGANPYALYAASNLGSFGGLIAYPLLVEPNMSVSMQSWGWSAIYALLALLVFACGLVTITVMRGNGAMAKASAPTSPPPGWKRIALWTALSAVPSGLMLSTTTHLTTDMVAMPLMWAIPLGLYLLSFSIAFAARRWLADFFTLLAPAMLLLAGGLAMLSGGEGLVMSAGTSLIMLFCVAVSLHSRLYSLRPDNDRLTYFYLVMAVGGVLGGLFCALFAPMAFDWVYEHPILVVAAAILLPLPPLIPWADYLNMPHQWHRIISLALGLIAAVTGYWLGQHWSGQIGTPQFIAIAIIAFCGLAAIGWRLAFITALGALLFGFGGMETLSISFNGDRTRSYFGVYTLREHDGQRTLSHGTTLHGTQLLGAGLSRTRTSYYGPTSGVGLAFDRANRLYGNAARIGVVGLGTGTLSCYRQPGQDWTFYEIDPAMEQLARSTGRFTYLSQCAPDSPIIIGDARLKLQDRAPASLDLLAVDAFSSDAIPIHLLTREAFGVYGRAVHPNGVVLVHISNRFVNLEPVLKALVTEDGWHAMLRYDMPDAQDYALARTGSIWVAMSRSQGAIDRLVAASADAPGDRGHWRALDPNQPGRLWTDDYASVMPLLMEPDFVRWIRERLS
ncbi:MAG: hypothetical protein ABL909_05445 [Sphingopyxis sp.]